MSHDVQFAYVPQNIFQNMYRDICRLTIVKPDHGRSSCKPRKEHVNIRQTEEPNRAYAS